MKQEKRTVRSARLPVIVIALSGFLLAASPASATTLEPQGPSTGTVGTPFTVSAVLGGLVSQLPSTVTFRIFGPQDAACALTPVATSTVPATDPGTYTSDPFTPTVVGTYRFTASYEGDGANPPATTSCGDPRAAIVISSPATPPAADTTPPQTTITKEPADVSGKNKVKYKFAANEPGSTFECKIDKKPFKPCTSPRKFKVKDGKHKFLVRAIDAAGNADPTADKDKFKVVD